MKFIGEFIVYKYKCITIYPSWQCYSLVQIEIKSYIIQNIILYRGFELYFQKFVGYIMVYMQGLLDNFWSVNLTRKV